MVWAGSTWFCKSGEVMPVKGLLEVSNLDWLSEVGYLSTACMLFANTIAFWAEGEAFADAGRGANVDASGEGTCG